MKIEAHQFSQLADFFRLPPKEQANVKEQIVRERFIEKFREGKRNEVIYAELMEEFHYKSAQYIKRMIKPRKVISYVRQED